MPLVRIDILEGRPPEVIEEPRTGVAQLAADRPSATTAMRVR